MVEFKHLDDYIRQKEQYEEQLEAKKYMDLLGDSHVKKISEMEWPNNYIMKKFEYIEQLEAKNCMKLLDDSNTKRIAEENDPQDYVEQKIYCKYFNYHG